MDREVPPPALVPNEDVELMLKLLLHGEARKCEQSTHEI